MQKKRWIRRKLPIFICTFFIILYVDFQLRSSSLPKLSVAHPLVPGPLQRSIQEAPSPARDAQIPGGNSSDSREEDGGHSDSESAHATLPELKLEDIFIAFSISCIEEQHDIVLMSPVDHMHILHISYVMHMLETWQRNGKIAF
ncbi:Beta-13-N-acetylglucosaminyltransferase manic fringe [Dissostichus eleginoides]|uniref:Beta-13-N-acetylglucosaminyltransferase manic fringe n=1 Tax=Dissostichus eleginoides TaxID=100907 RepID=A0AAD9BKL8_DISEL|nr:Beta-13-N-acetylglucosaminyltransferase manic fringe [Dissostichus eleginoides]